MNRLLNKYVTATAKGGAIKRTARLGRVSNLFSVTDGLPVVRKLRPGMLITFFYRPKGVNFLPYWDSHPLVMINEIKLDGWIGMNFHYVHPDIRKAVLSGADPGQNISKRYLATHVQGNLYEITPQYIDAAMQIPYENFQRVANSTVWKKGNR